MNRTSLQERLQELGLEHYFQSLQPFFKNTIRLYPQESSEQEIPIGQTKIGGMPDLPPDLSWPMETQTIVTTERKYLFFNSKKEESVTIPLSFIAQLNLREISPLDTEKLLPESGILYFFYSSEEDWWGGDESDRSRFMVMYWDGDCSDLQRSLPPIHNENALFKVAAVSIKQEISLPPLEHDVYDKLQGKDQHKFFDEIFPDKTINKILGYSDNIQGEMELDTELITNGLQTSSTAAYNHPSARFLAPNAKDWFLLLQVDSNEENEMCWWDSGRLYFWIKKQDLLQKKFDNCWCWMQCY